MNHPVQHQSRRNHTIPESTSKTQSGACLSGLRKYAGIEVPWARIKLVLAWSSGSGVKMGNKRNRNNFINVNGFIKKRKKQVSVIVEIILEIFKNFCQRELLMCYHMSISPLGGLADSFMATLFYHKPWGDILFCNKKCRIYAAFGVSQTHNNTYFTKGT